MTIIATFDFASGPGYIQKSEEIVERAQKCDVPKMYFRCFLPQDASIAIARNFDTVWAELILPNFPGVSNYFYPYVGLTQATFQEKIHPWLAPCVEMILMCQYNSVQLPKRTSKATRLAVNQFQSQLTDFLVGNTLDMRAITAVTTWTEQARQNEINMRLEQIAKSVQDEVWPRIWEKYAPEHAALEQKQQRDFLQHCYAEFEKFDFSDPIFSGLSQDEVLDRLSQIKSKKRVFLPHV